MAIPGLEIDSEELQQFGTKGVTQYRSALLPWHRPGARQNVGDAIDDVVDWYLRFRPDLLEDALRG